MLSPDVNEASAEAVSLAEVEVLVALGFRAGPTAPMKNSWSIALRFAFTVREGAGLFRKPSILDCFSFSFSVMQQLVHMC